ncbi:hypothetical protein WICPIJ_004047 [Wickerhamomyces pijperi]|uniref:Uncharacterized protein n=1 Tax=Wickerhamomyces pijperi TaxID=599730 RepID=A0A9P8Q6B6_WICPI|nr:hypothetical protein WICPIJ_004047 [Wickerhamomyces pijperi]
MLSPIKHNNPNKFQIKTTIHELLLPFILLLLTLGTTPTEAALYHQCHPLPSHSQITLTVQRNSSILVYPLKSQLYSNIPSLISDEGIKRNIQGFTVCGVKDLWCFEDKAKKFAFGQFTVQGNGEDLMKDIGPMLNVFVQDQRDDLNRDAQTVIRFHNEDNPAVYCTLIYQDGIYTKEFDIKVEIGQRRSLLSLTETKRALILWILFICQFVALWILGGGDKQHETAVFASRTLKLSLFGIGVEVGCLFVKSQWLFKYKDSLIVDLILAFVTNLSYYPLFLYLFRLNLLQSSNNGFKLVSQSTIVYPLMVLKFVSDTLGTLLPSSATPEVISLFLNALILFVCTYGIYQASTSAYSSRLKTVPPLIPLFLSLPYNVIRFATIVMVSSFNQQNWIFLQSLQVNDSFAWCLVEHLQSFWVLVLVLLISVFRFPNGSNFNFSTMVASAESGMDLERTLAKSDKGLVKEQ